MINDNNKRIIVTVYILEKALPSKTLSMTGTSLSADELKCMDMDMVASSPSIMLTASPKRLIVTPENPYIN